MKSSLKRLLSLCLSLALLLILFPASQAEANEENDPLNCLSYSITGNSVTITRWDYSNTGRLVIPDTIEGLPVTTIGWRALAYSQFSEIVLPDTVTEIREQAFMSCQNLTSIKLSNHLKTIGALAFDDSALTELIVPASVNNIDKFALNVRSLKIVIFLGNPPHFDSYTLGDNSNWGDGSVFSGTIYYPIHNPKWTTDITSKSYGAYYVRWVGDHNWDEGTTVLEANCTSQGTIQYECTVCEETKTETTPALGHNWADGTVISQPTCTQDGICRYTCTICDHTKEEPVNATGHIWGNATVVTAPSCEEGTLGYICTQCGTVGNYEPLPALGHSYETVLEDATCTQSGTLTYTCTKCGDVRITETSPATGHQFQEGVWITQPSCLEGGQKSYTCCTCGFVKYVDVAATGHNEATTPAVPATCTATGLTEGKHCGTCNEILTPQETITATGHSYQTVVTKPTCTEDGSTTATCSICGDVVNSIISATGHSYKTIVTPPTCTEDGVTSTTCTNCGETFIGVIPATGHQFENGSCTHCGEPEVVIVPGDASGDGKVNMADVAKVFSHVRSKNLLTDEISILCADVTGDGKINMADVARIFAHARGTNPLF